MPSQTQMLQEKHVLPEKSEQGAGFTVTGSSGSTVLLSDTSHWSLITF